MSEKKGTPQPESQLDKFLGLFRTRTSQTPSSTPSGETQGRRRSGAVSVVTPETAAPLGQPLGESSGLRSGAISTRVSPMAPASRGTSTESPAKMRRERLSAITGQEFRRQRAGAVSSGTPGVVIPSPATPGTSTESPAKMRRERLSAITGRQFGRQRAGAVSSGTPGVATPTPPPSRIRTQSPDPAPIPRQRSVAISKPIYQRPVPTEPISSGIDIKEEEQEEDSDSDILSVTPSDAYRDYVKEKQTDKHLSGFQFYDPFGEQRGAHIPFDPIDGQYPAPGTHELGQSDVGYADQHSSEEFLPDSRGERAVYGTDKKGRSIQGAAAWQHYYSNWSELGSHFQDMPPVDKPLRQEEIDFVAKFGIYFENQLGRGSYGTVWRCRTTKLFKGPDGQYIDEPLACKVLTLHRFRKNESEGLEFVIQKFTREVDLHSTLNHRNIVKCEHFLYIHDPETGFPFCRLLMFMEVCDGDLKQMLENRPNKVFSENEAKVVIRDISNGLQYMHNQNVCHLDIKIHNIMYKWEGSGVCYKLADFGVSKRYMSERVAKVFGAVGTRIYMAPELQRRPSGLSESKPADIYSLGAVMAEIVGGRAKMKQLLSDQQRMGLSSEFHDKWGIGPQCGSLIVRMTAIDVRSRPTISEVLQDQWFRRESES